MGGWEVSLSQNNQNVKSNATVNNNSMQNNKNNTKGGFSYVETKEINNFYQDQNTYCGKCAGAYSCLDLDFIVVYDF